MNNKDIILQGEPSECGLACLTYISKFNHGKEYSLVDLRKMSRPSNLGSTLLSLTEVSQTMGLLSKPVQYEPSYYEQLPTPCILHLESNHYVVLEQVNPLYSVVMNPALGRQIIRNSLIKMGLSGYALVFDGIKNKSKKTRKEDKNINLDLSIILSGVIISLLSTILPAYLFGFDSFISNGNFDFKLLIAFFISQIIVLLLLRFQIKRKVSIESFAMVSNITNIYKKLLTNKVLFFERRTPPDTTNKLLKLTEARISNSTLYSYMAVDLVQLLTSFCVLFYISPALASVVFVFSIMSSLLSMLEKNKVAQLNHISQEFDERTFKFINESNHIIYDIKSSKQINSFGSKLESLLLKCAKFNASESMNLFRFSAMKSLLFSIEVAVIFIICFELIQREMLSLPVLLIFFFVKQIANSAISDMCEKYVTLGEIQNSELRGQDIIDFESEQIALGKDSHSKLTEKGGAIYTQDLMFSYENKKICYSNMEFELNKTTAIIGHSGCGKTTLLRIMSGYYLPDNGKILHNNHVINVNCRNIFYYHSSSQQFFSSSLRDNITLHRGINDKELYTIISDLGLTSLVASLPDGINTQVSESTHPFSEGEKSRLLLCRAFVSELPILLIDEPTKSLDREMSLDIMDKIRSMKRTVIFTSHDVDLLGNIDAVISLED